MKSYTLSRRDDLESLCYTLMYMQDLPNFPWINAQSIEEILQIKERFMTNGLKTHPQFEGVHALLKYVTELSYTEDPDYEKVKTMLKSLFIYDERIK
jgi:hypothetical protein